VVVITRCYYDVTRDGKRLGRRGLRASCVAVRVAADSRCDHPPPLRGQRSPLTSRWSVFWWSSPVHDVHGTILVWPDLISLLILLLPFFLGIKSARRDSGWFSVAITHRSTAVSRSLTSGGIHGCWLAPVSEIALDNWHLFFFFFFVSLCQKPLGPNTILLHVARSCDSWTASHSVRSVQSVILSVHLFEGLSLCRMSSTDPGQLTQLRQIDTIDRCVITWRGIIAPTSSCSVPPYRRRRRRHQWRVSVVFVWLILYPVLPR